MINTKERIVDATVELFRRHGYTGTGMKQIVAAANAPFGSLYHHFPGGKEQLGVEVIQHSGEFYRHLFEGIMDASTDVVAGVGNLFIGAAATLEATGYADACPIATVALEVASTNEPLRHATADVFASWINAAAARFAAAGIDNEESRQLAISTIGALEGAFILSRAMRTTEPVEIAGRRAAAAVRAALAPDR